MAYFLIFAIIGHVFVSRGVPMSASVSNNNWDMFDRIAVPVIASFSPKQGILPLYVRIGRNDLKIISATDVTPAAFRQNPRFKCVVDDNGIRKELLLVFQASHGEFVWTAPRKDVENSSTDYI